MINFMKWKNIILKRRWWHQWYDCPLLDLLIIALWAIIPIALSAFNSQTVHLLFLQHKFGSYHFPARRENDIPQFIATQLRYVRWIGLNWKTRSKFTTINLLTFKAMAKIAQTKIANKSNKSNFDPIKSNLDLVY